MLTDRCGVRNREQAQQRRESHLASSGERGYSESYS